MWVFDVESCSFSSGAGLGGGVSGLFAPPSVGWGTGNICIPGCLLEMQHLSSHPTATHQDVHFNKVPGDPYAPSR